MNDPDVDARFAEIVAQWEAEAAQTAQQRATDHSPDDDTDTHDAADAHDDTHGHDGADDASPAATQGTAPLAADAQGGDGADEGLQVEDLADPTRSDDPRTHPQPMPPASQPGTLPGVWRGPSRDPEGSDGHGLVDDLAALDALPPADDPDEGHFEPPEVELPPQEDLHYWGAVGGLVIGPLLLLWVVFARPFYSGWWLLASFTLMIGGFALLVLRQPKDRDEDDDGVRL